MITQSMYQNKFIQNKNIKKKALKIATQKKLNKL